MKSAIFYLTALVVLAGCTNTKKAIKSPESITVEAKNAIQDIAQATIFNDSNFATAHIGISIYNPATQQYLYNYQGDKYFVPASNMKLFTCYAAMKNLSDSLVGLRYSLFNDTLVLQGNADATILHDDYKSDEFLHLIGQPKIKAIIIDDRNWKDNGFGKGWSWDDYNDDYLAERGPLPLYGNVVKFIFNNDELTTKPELGLTFTNFNTYKSFSLKRQFHDNKFSFVPAAKTPKELSIPLIINGAQTAQKIIATITGRQNVFSISQLTQSKISFSIVKPNSILKTQPTDSLLKPMMHNSDNFFAEQTLLMVSNEKLGVMSDERIIDTLLKTDFKGLPQKPRWVDGSGLSRYNLITPQDFVWVLNKMKADFSWQRITTILPTGNEGTLNNYYKNLAGNIFAKTGTLSSQVALSGYLITKRGETLVFSVLVNNHQTSATAIRRGVEKFLTQVYEQY
jgi:D-alanyl-D-alanine carboxypeptidase/D-alanyl-D-alanine-endopeptidase (penicillin-binding protein 4)